MNIQGTITSFISTTQFRAIVNYPLTVTTNNLTIVATVQHGLGYGSFLFV